MIVLTNQFSILTSSDNKWSFHSGLNPRRGHFHSGMEHSCKPWMHYSRDRRSWMPRARRSWPSSLLLGPCNPCPWPIAWIKRVQGLRRRFKPETSDGWKYMGEIYLSPDALLVQVQHSFGREWLTGICAAHTATYPDGKTKVRLGNSSGIKARVSVRSAKYKLALGFAQPLAPNTNNFWREMQRAVTRVATSARNLQWIGIKSERRNSREETRVDEEDKGSFRLCSKE